MNISEPTIETKLPSVYLDSNLEDVYIAVPRFFIVSYYTFLRAEYIAN